MAVTVDNWKELERHPLSAAYEDLKGRAWKSFVETVREHGVINSRYIMLHEGMVIDGWQLLRACVEADVEPWFEKLTLPPGMTAEEWVETVNDQRRHETPEKVSDRVAKRRERIAAARQEGQSTRTIAEAEGISHTQVNRDLEASTGTGVPVEPESGKVTGQDGRQQPATKPAKPAKTPDQLCDRCNRVAPGVGVKGCPACKDIQRPATAPKPKPKAETNGHAEENAPVDAFGAVVPKPLRDAFCDPWIQNTIDYLAPLVAAFWAERHAQGMRKRASRYPWFNSKDFQDGCGMAGNTLDQILEHLKEFRPAGVCPMCAGKKCPDCRMSGLVPRKAYAELKKKAKEKAKAEK
jgi:hypothetical protein